MAAGEATRTVPLTLTRPKALLPIAHKPLAKHQLDALHALVDEAIFIVGYKADMIRDALGDEYRDMEDHLCRAARAKRHGPRPTPMPQPRR